MIDRIFFMLVGILIIVFVYKGVNNKRISEKESFFWVVGSIGILILSIYPYIIDKVSKLLHINYPPSLLFLMGIIFCLGLIFRITTYISVLKEQTKELAQYNSILERRLQELEDKY